MQSDPPRVVVTGAGIITGLGRDWESNAQGFRTGRLAFRPVTLFDVSKHRAKQAAEVDLPSELPEMRLTRKELKRLDRATLLLLVAAEEALRQARWSLFEGLRVVLGTTSGGMSQGEAYFRQAWSTPVRHPGQPTRIVHYQAQTQGLLLGKALDSMPRY